MARRQNRTKATAPVEEEAKATAPVEAKAEVVKKSDGLVEVICINVVKVVHPCRTTIFPNSSGSLPDDNWTKAQIEAGLLKTV